MPVENRVIRSFVRRRPARAGDTETDGQRLVWRGRVIAWHEGDDAYRMTLAGEKLPRVRRRLNVLLMTIGSPYSFHSDLGNPWIEGMGEWAKVEHDDVILVRPHQRPEIEGPLSGVWETGQGRRYYS